MTPLTERQRLLLAYGCTQSASVVEAIEQVADPSLTFNTIIDARDTLRTLLRFWARDQLLLTWYETAQLDYEHTLAHARAYLTERVVELDALLAEIKEGGGDGGGRGLEAGPSADAAQAGRVVPAG